MAKTATSTPPATFNTVSRLGLADAVAAVVDSSLIAVVVETAFFDDTDVLSAALAAVLKKSHMDDDEKDEDDGVIKVATCFFSSFVVLVESLTVDEASCVLKERLFPRDRGGGFHEAVGVRTKACAVGGPKVAMATNSKQSRNEADEALGDGGANLREFMMGIGGVS
jgi:hypothetical protein